MQSLFYLIATLVRTELSWLAEVGALNLVLLFSLAVLALLIALVIHQRLERGRV